jgi:hypothetical protein
MRHGSVTRDSRVVSHPLSQCPDPTRPDPLNTYFPSIPYLGRSSSERWMALSAMFGGGH